jgi:proteasome-associated ATPase
MTPPRNDEEASGRPAVPQRGRGYVPMPNQGGYDYAASRIRELEERILELKREVARRAEQNDRLAATLKEARTQIASLRQELEKLTGPPSSFAIYLGSADGKTADVSVGGRKYRVGVHPSIDLSSLVVGQEVLLNEAMNLVGVRGAERHGEIMTVKEVLDDGRLLVLGNGDEERVVTLSGYVRDEKIRVGDLVRVDVRSELVLERMRRPEVEELILEEVPDVTYDDIGGLDEQIEAIQDAVELPFLYPDLFRRYNLPAPKGVLLYGPPGCGKTLIAKAVANSLAKKVAERTGAANPRSYFLNIKGPELLNKYVGETERQIRLIFQRAREKSAEGVPVIVFFDEMDSLFRTRGSGISSDIENTIVPQLLSEIDGVESLKNVIVVGASNREDLIDPAILRPGRLDVKIKIERPNEKAARDILSKYLRPDLPLHPKELEQEGGDRQAVIEHMIDVTVKDMYADTEENRFLEVTYANGDKEVLYFRDFASGAMIENIVRRAKKEAIKRQIETGEEGLRTDDLLVAVRREFREHEDLPNTTNPDDWAKISGKKGERIIYVRTLVDEGTASRGGRSIEAINTGQFL